MRLWFKLLRPHQWIKNGFVLIGVLFSRQWDEPHIVAGILLFAAFCAGSSSVYVLNDIFDVDADRRHPLKKHRPIASGRVSIAQARALVVALFVVALGLSYMAHPMATVYVVAYWVMNLGYSLWFKHVPILDVFTIASGFMLRIFAGTAGLGLGFSYWLVLCGMMITLFLGFSKRRAELLLLTRQEQHSPQATRRVLEHYQPAQLDQYIGVTAAGAILSYSLYTMSPEVRAQLGTGDLIFTVPLVVYGIFRYILLLHGHGKGSDTARDLLQDPHLLATVGAWATLTAILLGVAR
jgi:4-hydroxybenzoate polyprenyltransferase